ncbi:hypothetical protein AB0F59_30550 [Micromonospora lupini]|uniref:hypothetical protein n=1 Tax=Micromonospora lupini TaxID=285679 RepID=UPI0033C0EDA3
MPVARIAGFQTPELNIERDGARPAGVVRYSSTVRGSPVSVSHGRVTGTGASEGCLKMPLRPYVPVGWSKRLTNVRIYLDDIDRAVSELAAKGETRLVASHKGGRLSTCDTSDDLVGREDIAGILVMLVTPHEHEHVEIEVDASSVRVDVGTDRHDMKVLVESLIDSLERIKPIKFVVPLPIATLGAFRVSEVVSNRVQLILDRRVSAFQARQQRQHNLVVGLTSGIAGAVLGAAATIAVALLDKS